ncbi:hypothetical protein SporoP37_12680 [Sporosarcina sp. P37]|uniref:hypothetical protein n=1 Tax=unclassified Sporosarcina TaxID=2647733 RepID=UPI000A17FA6D|nr:MULTISPECIES: hypothetical protein [unclassified Sporosarcina]ARK25427.1 hypothetical protein SporoP37_12680 [Sporosarcina sp. P37]PID19019.1 hypothetical protein CSV62_05290 [Sporosarcina sp. P35]
MNGAVKVLDDFGGSFFHGVGALLDSVSGFEVSECQFLGPAQARGGLPFVMSQLAKSAPVVS